MSFRNNNEGLTNIVCENIQVYNCKILTDFSNIYGQEEGQGNTENYPEKEPKVFCASNVINIDIYIIIIVFGYC